MSFPKFIGSRKGEFNLLFSVEDDLLTIWKVDNFLDSNDPKPPMTFVEMHIIPEKGGKIVDLIVSRSFLSQNQILIAVIKHFGFCLFEFENEKKLKLANVFENEQLCLQRGVVSFLNLSTYIGMVAQKWMLLSGSDELIERERQWNKDEVILLMLPFPQSLFIKSIKVPEHWGKPSSLVMFKCVSYDCVVREGQLEVRWEFQYDSLDMRDCEPKIINSLLFFISNQELNIYHEFEGLIKSYNLNGVSIIKPKISVWRNLEDGEEWNFIVFGAEQDCYSLTTQRDSIVVHSQDRLLPLMQILKNTSHVVVSESGFLIHRGEDKLHLFDMNESPIKKLISFHVPFFIPSNEATQWEMMGNNHSILHHSDLDYIVKYTYPSISMMEADESNYEIEQLNQPIKNLFVNAHLNSLLGINLVGMTIFVDEFEFNEANNGNSILLLHETMSYKMIVSTSKIQIFMKENATTKSFDPTSNITPFLSNIAHGIVLNCGGVDILCLANTYHIVLLDVFDLMNLDGGCQLSSSNIHHIPLEKYIEGGELASISLLFDENQAQINISTSFWYPIETILMISASLTFSNQSYSIQKFDVIECEHEETKQSKNRHNVISSSSSNNAIDTYSIREIQSIDSNLLLFLRGSTLIFAQNNQVIESWELDGKGILSIQSILKKSKLSIFLITNHSNAYFLIFYENDQDDPLPSYLLYNCDFQDFSFPQGSIKHFYPLFNLENFRDFNDFSQCNFQEIFQFIEIGVIFQLEDDRESTLLTSHHVKFIPIFNPIEMHSRNISNNRQIRPMILHRSKSHSLRQIITSGKDGDFLWKFSSQNTQILRLNGWELKELYSEQIEQLNDQSCNESQINLMECKLIDHVVIEERENVLSLLHFDGKERLIVCLDKLELLMEGSNFKSFYPINRDAVVVCDSSNSFLYLISIEEKELGVGFKVVESRLVEEGIIYVTSTYSFIFILTLFGIVVHLKENLEPISRIPVTRDEGDEISLIGAAELEHVITIIGISNRTKTFTKLNLLRVTSETNDSDIKRLELISTEQDEDLDNFQTESCNMIRYNYQIGGWEILKDNGKVQTIESKI